MTYFERLIIIESSNFLAILKNSKKILKNIKFDPKLNFHMKNILTGQIDHLNFENKKIVRSTRTILATRNTIAKLYKFCIFYMKDTIGITQQNRKNARYAIHTLTSQRQKNVPGT
jgi:hypothetical protein